MTDVFIIRHAEVTCPLDKQGRKLMYPPETPISQIGIDQFTAFAHQLKMRGVKLDMIVTSPYTRATQTAQILAHTFGLQGFNENPAFVDSFIPGWIGIPLSEQQKLMDNGEDIYMHPRSPDQEPYEDIVKRMVEGFNKLIVDYQGRSIAIVSHGDPIRLLMYRIDHPEGKIPNMSVLSSEGYLKRGEAFSVEVDKQGKILKTELLSNLGGKEGARELYTDNAV